MAIVEVRSTLSHRSLVKRRKSDLRLLLSQIAEHPGLTADSLASAIMHLSSRIPPEKG